MSKLQKPNATEYVSKRPSLIWFRQDLRLEDNPALLAAVGRRAPIIPVYIWSPNNELDWTPGAASRVWLHQSLLALGADLEKLGSQLILREGELSIVLSKLIEETSAGALFWNRRYEPTTQTTDKILADELEKKFDGLSINTFNGSLLFEPWQIKQKNNKPYQVFTAFWRACELYGEPQPPAARPKSLMRPNKWPESLTIEQLSLTSTRSWVNDIKKFWPASSSAANKQLREFIANGLEEYNTGRNRPDLQLVSKLSPYLHLGQLSPRQIYHAVKFAMAQSTDHDFIGNCQTYLKEIGWREFAYHLLFYFPHTPDKPLRAQYEKFPWHLNKAYLDAWQMGQTGYPIVDAGMRQLWQTGWMHNRVRMIVASFLVKDLFIPWQFGAKWFWDTLVDADLANNTLGWQWTAGCGADAAPYFRVFNPITQGQKFDPKGDYVRRFVPELNNLPVKYIHSPWLADEKILQDANVELGKNYPLPIVNHTEARLKALAAWRQMGEDKAESMGAKK